MAVQYVKRGEIYPVLEDSRPGETALSRPGLVVSSNVGNDASDSVIVLMLTTKDHDVGIHYATKATGRMSYIMCDQIRTVSKTRLGRLMGIMRPEEMDEIDSRIDEVLDLGYVDDTPLKEKEKEVEALKLQIQELKDENAELKNKQSSHEAEMQAQKVKYDVWKGLYLKAVGMIIDNKFDEDVATREKEPKVEPVLRGPELSQPELPKKESPQPELPPQELPQPKLVDINSAKFTVLRGLGLSNNLILTLINKRPFKRIQDLKKLPGMTNVKYNLIKDKVCCVPVLTPVAPPVEAPVVDEPEKKINVNTATVEELEKGLGLGFVTCRRIVQYRNANGKYKTPDDIMVIKRISQKKMEEIRGMIEV